ncbi:MAG: RNA-directed DNA polymerase [Candidatus Nitrotoga sp.]|nr:RNA-directed DNA polymerase [Candidatus Nitrotoga sp.]
MFGVDQTLLIRALNSTRQSYFPSYVGLRLIGDQLPPGENEYLQQLIRRRLIAGDTWRFKKFDLYKGSMQSRQGVEHVYRDCLAPSPLTAIAESLVLALLASNPVFAVSPRAYSYRWPLSDRSGASYEFFAEGYKQRNTEISTALDTPNQIAVITDIKSLYPSASNEQVESALKSLLDKSDKQFRSSGDAILGFYSQLLIAGGNGIPIGPVSSHVLGHLILQDVDRELTSKYGERYFRYVDDMVVVCHEDEESIVKRDIQHCIEQHGFLLNIDKTVVINGTEWHKNLLRSDVSDEDSFRSFSSDMTVYLAFHPDRADSLKKMLAEKGLSIPVGRLLALSSYSRFRYFLGRRKARSGLTHAFGLLFSTNEYFLQRGLHLKSMYERSLSALVDEPVEASPNLRRWQVQRARRVMNSLFYLRRFGEWDIQRGIFDVLPELVKQRALAEALSSGIVNPILPFYGRGPAAFSELWAEHGHSSATLLAPKTNLNRAEIDGLITLRLYGTIPADLIQSLSNRKDARLLRVVNQTTSMARATPDLSFEDEFESLRLGTSDQEIAELAHTRYALSEGTALEALSLFSSEYRS